MAGEERVAELAAENDRLRAEVVELLGLVAELKSRVADLESKLGRTSKNSSIPPSRDPNATREEAKLNRAQRRAAGRRQGKQPGAEGHHLSQVADPHRRVTHRPSACAGCGRDLTGVAVTGSEKRRCSTFP